VEKFARWGDDREPHLQAGLAPNVPDELEATQLTRYSIGCHSILLTVVYLSLCIDTSCLDASFLDSVAAEKPPRPSSSALRTFLKSYES
jgi:hypothetical protein